MIVQARIARLLTEGTATQLRLPVGPPQKLNGGQQVPARCPVAVGRDYPVRPVTITPVTVEADDGDYTIDHRETGRALDTRLLVVSVTRSTLLDLTYRDAQREGYRAASWREDIQADFRLTYGKARPDTPVWVIGVQPQHDRPRFLAPSGSQATRMGVRREGDEQDFTGPEHDYVTSPAGALDDGEVLLPDAEWQRRAQARHAKAVRRARAIELAEKVRAA